MKPLVTKVALLSQMSRYLPRPVQLTRSSMLSRAGGLEIIVDSHDNSIFTSGRECQTVVPSSGARLPHDRNGAKGVAVPCQGKSVDVETHKNDVR